MFISGTEFDRSVSVLAKGAENIKLITFPGTVREARDGALSEQGKDARVLESVILNEGLEKLGGLRSEDKKCHSGAISGTRVRKIVLPSTLKVLGDNTFYNCRSISQILFRQKAPSAPDSTMLQ